MVGGPFANNLPASSAQFVFKTSMNASCGRTCAHCNPRTRRRDWRVLNPHPDWPERCAPHKTGKWKKRPGSSSTRNDDRTAQPPSRVPPLTHGIQTYGRGGSSRPLMSCRTVVPRRAASSLSQRIHRTLNASSSSDTFTRRCCSAAVSLPLRRFSMSERCSLTSAGGAPRVMPDRRTRSRLDGWRAFLRLRKAIN